MFVVVTKLIRIPSKKMCGKLNMRFRVNSIPSVFRGCTVNFNIYERLTLSPMNSQGKT